MKEKIGFLIVSVLLSATLALCGVAIAEQNDWFPSSQQNDNWDEGDSIKVAQIYEQLESPKLYTIKDVLDFQEQMIQETTAKELFLSLLRENFSPEQTDKFSELQFLTTLQLAYKFEDMIDISKSSLSHWLLDEGYQTTTFEGNLAWVMYTRKTNI